VTIAVITAANSGSGRALIEGFAREFGPDTHLYLTGRNPERIRSAADKLAAAGLPVIRTDSTSLRVGQVLSRE
jgi:NADP-dependent 3-hydroxy acid dehydrogenase YdfG